MKYLKGYQQRWRQMVAIVPYYRANGRTACRVYYLDGNYEDWSCRGESIVTNMAGFFCTTVGLAQQRATRLLGEDKERKVPFLLHAEYCLIPLKCREEERPHSGTLGYAVLRHLDWVEQRVHGVTLHFKGGRVSLEIPQCIGTVNKQIERARRLHYNFLREMEEQW